MAEIENDTEPLDDERVNLSWQVSDVWRSTFDVRRSTFGGRREEAEMILFWGSEGPAF
jgi:hypothetical protein